MDTVHEDVCTFMTIFRCILLRMRNVSNKSCRGAHNTHFMFSKFFFSKNPTVYEKMSKDTEPDRPQTVWCMRVASLMSKATRATVHSLVRAPTTSRKHTRLHTQKYVVLIAFPPQRWFRERASIILYAYIDCLLSCVIPVLASSATDPISGCWCRGIISLQ
jgi:hypothetical protein